MINSITLSTPFRRECLCTFIAEKKYLLSHWNGSIGGWISFRSERTKWIWKYLSKYCETLFYKIHHSNIENRFLYFVLVRIKHKHSQLLYTESMRFSFFFNTELSSNLSRNWNCKFSSYIQVSSCLERAITIIDNT